MPAPPHNADDSPPSSAEEGTDKRRGQIPRPVGLSGREGKPEQQHVKQVAAEENPEPRPYPQQQDNAREHTKYYPHRIGPPGSDRAESIQPGLAVLQFNGSMFT